jgi:hypothetical protein
VNLVELLRVAQGDFDKVKTIDEEDLNRAGHGFALLQVGRFTNEPVDFARPKFHVKKLPTWRQYSIVGRLGWKHHPKSVVVFFWVKKISTD